MAFRPGMLCDGRLRGLACDASFLMLFESSFEASLGLTDVDHSTRARHFVYYVRLFLDGERVFDLSEHVPCSCGMVYIGETKRRLETRLKEHKEACVKGQTTKSAITEYAWLEGHPINWDGTRILQCASHTMELVMKEAMCIQSTPTDSRFNRDSGYELLDCWIALNRKLKGGALVGAPRTSAGRTRSIM